jgi:hypothetical protein
MLTMLVWDVLSISGGDPGGGKVEESFVGPMSCAKAMAREERQIQMEDFARGGRCVDAILSGAPKR